jgi:hypothetical protein
MKSLTPLLALFLLITSIAFANPPIRPDSNEALSQSLPAQTVKEAVRLVEAFTSTDRGWLRQNVDYMLYSPDFILVFTIYGDASCLQQIPGWEDFQATSHKREFTWFIAYEHPQLDKKIVFRVLRDGQVLVLTPGEALLMACSYTSDFPSFK